MIKKIFLTICFLPFFIIAQNYPTKPSNYVTDLSGTLSNSEQNSLNTKLAAFEKSTSNQIFIFVAPSLNGSDMASLSQEIFHAWRIGGKEKNNGLLVAIFINDRKFRIQTGYGLEGALPDILTKKIQDEEMRPYFKKGDYYAGINNGIDKLIYYSQNEFKAEELEAKNDDWIGWVFGYAANLLLLCIYLYLLLRKKAKKRKPITKNVLMTLAIVLALVPCIGAIILFFMLIFLGEIKSSGGGSYSSSSDSSYSSYDSSSSSDSGSSFDGGGGGDSGGGGSSSDW